MSSLLSRMTIFDLYSVFTSIFVYGVGLLIIINDFRTGRSQDTVTVWIFSDVPRATYTVILCVTISTLSNYFRLILSAFVDYIKTKKENK